MKLTMPIVLLCIAFGLASFPAFAYMGPGAGLTAFGCLVALLAGIWYTCKGFLWLPLKRKFGKKPAVQPTEQQKNANVKDSVNDAKTSPTNDQRATPADKTS